VGDFFFQSGFEMASFLGGNPLCFARMISNTKPPDWKPDEWQHAFQNYHFVPAISSNSQPVKGAEPATARGWQRFQ